MKTADLHCDLLSYLAQPKSDIYSREMRANIPFLKEGNVKFQAMAIYASTDENSVKNAEKQIEIYRNICKSDEFFHLGKFEFTNDKIATLPALENASTFCTEEMTIKKGLENLEKFEEKLGRIFYITFTHHLENRFGGGNYTEIGLKDDGRDLLEFLDKKQIAVDFSHTSFKMAEDILNFISAKNITVPILASHSNFYETFPHSRNLKTEVAQEIIHQNGLIGLTFIKDFVNPRDENFFYKHLEFGLKIGAENALSFGADFFDDKAHPDQSRYPFFHESFADAGCYPKILEKISTDFGNNFTEKMAFKNVESFLKRTYFQ